MKKRHYNKSSTCHMCINIVGFLRNTGKKKIRIFDREDGTTATDKEARAYLAEELAKGHKLIPMGGDCYRFDPFNKGCLGHIKSLKPTNEVADKIELDWALFKQGKRL